VRNDDVIAGADMFILEGRIRGDLIVAGGSVTITPSGVVEGDLIAAGRQVAIQGQVKDDARIAGTALTIGPRASIGDDLIAAGQSLETVKGSTVGGGLLFGGGQALLAGNVAEGARLGAGGLDLKGWIRGGVHAAVGESGPQVASSPLAFFPGAPPVPYVPRGLTVRPGALIEGNLDYVAQQDGNIAPGAVSGKVTRQAPEVPVGPSPAERALRTFAALLAVGLLLLAILPGSVKEGAAELQAHPGPSLGWGMVSLAAAFVCVVMIVFATVLAAVALGTLSLGDLTALAILTGIVTLAAFALAFVITAVYASKVIVAYLGGRLLLSRVRPAWAETRVAPLIVGLLGLVLLGAVPYLGGAVHLLAALFGLGALWLLARVRLQRRRTAKELPQAGPEPAPEMRAAA
jgi:cytoskeletal protein CcmA (bactofilin family)